MALGSELCRRFVRLYRYVASLGLVQGLRLFGMEVCGVRRTVTVRCGSHRVFLRLHSTDILVLYTVFVREEYRWTPSRTPVVIIDAGAYVGYSAAYFAERFPQARILALEPDSANYEMLRLHAASYPRITAIHSALWSHAGHVLMNDTGSGEWGYSLVAARDAARESATVATTTVDGVMQEYGVEAISLLKMDIEGAEKTVFDHCLPWIDTVDTIAIEVHERLHRGCREAFETATSGFHHRWTRGMTEFVSRDDPASMGRTGGIRP